MKKSKFAGSIVALALLAVGIVTAGPATAATAPHVAPRAVVYTAVDADGGVYWRYLPTWSDTQSISGWGFYTGNQIELACWVTGGPAGPNNNTLWYLAENLTHPEDGQGYINDHYLNTPGTAASPQPQGDRCDGTLPDPHP
jgi:hypothetical protein